jgi:hypothetical protein
MTWVVYHKFRVPLKERFFECSEKTNIGTLHVYPASVALG